MANENLCFKDYLKCSDDKNFTKTRKQLNKKSPKGRYYGGVEGDQSGSVTESFLAELLSGNTGSFSANVLQNTPNEKEEEQEARGNKIDLARQLFQSLINRPDSTRQSIIQQFMDQVGVTHSTAVSYYERLAKEAGLTGKEDKEDLGQSVDMGNDMTASAPPVKELPADIDLNLDDEIGDDQDPQRSGIIRTVDNAHLIYKRRSEDGSFEELWVYNVGGHGTTDELNIRRDVLSGTDIPPKKTTSPDGSQSYTLTTMGNAQYLNIKGLVN